VEVGEERVVGAQHGPLDRLRLLDLDDHLARLEDLGARAGDVGAGLLVGDVVEAGTLAGAGLDDDLVAAGGELADDRGRGADPSLCGLDLARNTDAHGSLPEGSGPAASTGICANRTAAGAPRDCRVGARWRILRNQVA
jgi:hypothetical protein